MQAVIAILTLLFLDFLWLKFYMVEKYNVMIPQIQGSPLQPRMQYALIAYILMVIGLVLFVLPNIRQGYELQDSLVYGFGFGVVLYGVYDFTIATVLDNWDIKLALIDVLWGGIVYFIATYFATRFSR